MNALSVAFAYMLNILGLQYYLLSIIFKFNCKSDFTTCDEIFVNLRLTLLSNFCIL